MQITENPSQESLNNKGKLLVYVGKMQPSGTASSRFQLRFPLVLSPCLFLHASFVFWPASLMVASYSVCFLSHIQGSREGLFSNHRSETLCFIPVGSYVSIPEPIPEASTIPYQEGRSVYCAACVGFGQPGFQSQLCRL